MTFYDTRCFNLHKPGTLPSCKPGITSLFPTITFSGIIDITYNIALCVAILHCSTQSGIAFIRSFSEIKIYYIYY